MKKILIILLFLSQINLFAQTNYVHYTVKDGLPQMQCMTLFQDSKGYIWIGTKGGLSKYDGVKFINYTVNEGLPNNRIYSIKEDSKARIWALTAGGLSVLKNDKFVFYPIPKPFVFINAEIVIDKNDVFWLTEGMMHQRLIKFENGKYQTVFSSPENTSERILHLSYDKNKDKICFSRNDSLTSFRYEIKNNQTKLIKRTKEDVFCVNNEKIIVKLPIRHTKPFKSILYEKQKNDTISIAEISESIGVIKRLNDSTIVFTTQKFQINMPLHYIVNGVLQNNPKRFDYINDILQDDENNLWLASEKGLYKITPFNTYTEKDGMLNYVWSIVEDPTGRIWFSSYGNPYLYYFEQDKIHKYPKKFDTQSFFFGAIKTGDGAVLFPNGRGVYRYQNEKFSLDTLYKAHAVLSIYEDTISKKQYFGSFGGLVIKDSVGNITVNKRFVKEKDNLVMAMRKNKKGALWYVTRDAFGILNSKDTLVMHNNKLKGAMCLYIDYKDNLWIGSDRGLFLYNYKTVTKIYHPELQTMIGAIAQIDDKHFVYGGLRGIGIFDVEKFYRQIDIDSAKQTINAENFIDYYSQSNGFTGEEIGQVGIFKDSKGRVWVPTNNSVVMFNPKDLFKNTKAPKTYITQVTVSKDNNQWIKFTDSTKQLSYNFANIRFDFTGISHTAPEIVRYKYRLKGFSDEWSNPTKERYVTYTNLPHGQYTFELLARNNNNIWNVKPAQLSFEIMPAWWQTIWFKLMASILILTAIFGLFMSFHRRKIKKIQLTDRMSKLQLQSMQSQLYPHLLFNAVSATGAVIYKEDKNKAYDFVVKLSQFMRQALTDTKKMYKSLQEELDFVKAYLQLQKIRFSERFDYDISIDEQVDLTMQVPQMIIQTYVENAVKHGLEPLKQDGMLYISITKIDEGIRVVVQDNGVGVKRSSKMADQNTGIGLRIMNEIYEIHNQKHDCKISFKLVDLYQYNEVGTQSIIDIICAKNEVK